MYMSNKTSWRFTVPQAGEVDSAESVENRMVEIDKALIGPMNKAELVSNGRQLIPQSYVDGDKSFYSDVPDDYWSEIEGRPIYTTTSHYHPMPSIVRNSNNAENAGYAARAGNANTANSLTPGFTLNGHVVTGANNQVVTIKHDDIPDSPRVFWGANEPSSTSFPTLRRGDIYVRVL